MKKDAPRHPLHLSIALNLLDDSDEQATLKHGALSHSMNELTRTAHHVKPALKPEAQKPVAPQATDRVFSSRPTLRQMMGEYNRRVARMAPIKASSPVGSSHFHYDRVDLIEIPTIPGKILRPVGS